MTESAGPYALAIENFWWFAFILLTAVTVLVYGALAYAVWHRKRSRPSEAGMRKVVAGAVAATALILVAYLLVDLTTGRALAAPAGVRDPLLVTVTGHQWWWEVEYGDSVAARRLRTANELHIPAGREVRIEMRSGDVIHSFWVPQLQGKRDLIPGDTAYLWLKADRPGRYQGQCAEFCGHQHAHMRLEVVVHSPDRFAEWYEAQLRPAVSPRDPLRARGEEVFVGRSCVLCHQVRGTLAGGHTGPDLTHVASRRMLAAGTVPNTRGYLGGWIVDPQSIKPGTKMPPNDLSGPDLQALLAYLEGLE